MGIELAQVGQLSNWRLYEINFMYIPNQKFHSTRILVLRDTKNFFNKSTILKMSRTFNFHDNSEKFLKNYG